MPLDSGRPAVAFAAVWRAFGDVVAVNDLTFDVPPGTVTVLLGPNGAGKTTVVRLVTGACSVRTRARCARWASTPTPTPRAPRRGDAAAWCRPAPRSTTGCRAATTSSTRRHSSKWSRSSRRRVSARPRTASASRTRSASASAATRPACAPGSHWRRGAARSRPPPARRTHGRPRPGVGAQAVLGLIDEMAEGGKTVLMCTHLLLEAEGLADQVIVMDHGRAVVAGSPEEAQPTLLAGGARGARRRRPRGPRRRARTSPSCARTNATAP